MMLVILENVGFFCYATISNRYFTLKQKYLSVCLLLLGFFPFPLDDHRAEFSELFWSVLNSKLPSKQWHRFVCIVLLQMPCGEILQKENKKCFVVCDDVSTNVSFTYWTSWYLVKWFGCRLFHLFVSCCLYGLLFVTNSAGILLLRWFLPVVFYSCFAPLWKFATQFREYSSNSFSSTGLVIWPLTRFPSSGLVPQNEDLAQRERNLRCTQKRVLLEMSIAN